MLEHELQSYLEKNCSVKCNNLQYEALKAAFVDSNDRLFDEERQSGKSTACCIAASMGALVVSVSSERTRNLRRIFRDCFEGKNTTNIISAQSNQLMGFRESYCECVFFDDCFEIKRDFKEELFNRIVPQIIIEIGTSVEYIPSTTGQAEPRQVGSPDNIFLTEELADLREQKRVENKSW